MGESVRLATGSNLHYVGSEVRVSFSFPVRDLLTSRYIGRFVGGLY